MMVDPPDEHVVEPNGIANDPLAIISPDESDQALPVASDCTSRHQKTCPAMLPAYFGWLC